MGWFLLLFFLAGFNGFLARDRSVPGADLLLVGMAIAGVYWLGWWSLAVQLAGFVFGCWLHANKERGRR